MYGDHHVGVITVILFGDANPMAKITQNSSPAHRSGPIAGTGFFSCRGDEADFQRSSLTHLVTQNYTGRIGASASKYSPARMQKAGRNRRLVVI